MPCESEHDITPTLFLIALLQSKRLNPAQKGGVTNITEFRSLAAFKEFSQGDCAMLGDLR